MSTFLADARDFLPLLLDGLRVTIAITVCALIVSVLLGFIWALMGRSRLAALRGASRTLINTVRGIPIIVQLFYIYFVLPELGVRLDAFVAGVIGLGLAYSVYQAENFRAGFASVDRSLIEAAQSLGMRKPVIMRRLILPLATRVILPLRKHVHHVAEGLVHRFDHHRCGTHAGPANYWQFRLSRNMTVYTLVALLYLAMSLPLTFLTRWLERRFAVR